MKKDELLGIEVYYEDNPKQCEPRGHEGQTGEQGVHALEPAALAWMFGDSDEEDDFLNDEDELASWAHDEPCVPIKGRIYKANGLNVVARLKEIRPLTPTAGILEMDRHGSKFYINPSDLKRATPEEVESYLED